MNSYNIETIKVKLNVSDNIPEKITDSQTAVNILLPIFATLDDDQEHFVILILDSASKVTGYKHLFSGGMNSSLIDMKIIFRNTLLMCGASIIAAHNHPSGNTNPSPEDLLLTIKIQEAGKTLDIRVLDHIIINTKEQTHTSLSDQGMM